MVADDPRTSDPCSSVTRSLDVSEIRSVAVVGLGAMGLPMARRLAAAGYDVVAIDPAQRARARAGGMPAFADLASAGERDVVLVLVATGAQLGDVAGSRAARGRADGETWVICSTVGPPAAVAAAQSLGAAGATVVDAPVTGGVPGAEQGTLRFLAAGEPAARAAL